MTRACFSSMHECNECSGAHDLPSSTFAQCTYVYLLFLMCECRECLSYCLGCCFGDDIGQYLTAWIYQGSFLSTERYEGYCTLFLGLIEAYQLVWHLGLRPRIRSIDAQTRGYTSISPLQQSAITYSCAKAAAALQSGSKHDD